MCAALLSSFALVRALAPLRAPALFTPCLIGYPDWWVQSFPRDRQTQRPSTDTTSRACAETSAPRCRSEGGAWGVGGNCLHIDPGGVPANTSMRKSWKQGQSLFANLPAPLIRVHERQRTSGSIAQRSDLHNAGRQTAGQSSACPGSTSDDIQSQGVKNGMRCATPCRDIGSYGSQSSSPRWHQCRSNPLCTSALPTAS